MIAITLSFKYYDSLFGKDILEAYIIGPAAFL